MRTTHISWREQAGAGLLLAAVSLILVPTFAKGLACGHDTLTHFYRVVQLAVNVQNGAPFLQWSPDFMRGYGYTIYPFYAPLMYWITAGIHFLGFDFSPSIRIAAWLMLWAAGWGGYNLGRRYLNPAGALVTGLAYLFAPYMLYNSTQRGAFPELLGLALLPWALTSADLALARRTRRSIMIATAVLALVMLAHNIIPNMGFAILLALSLGHSQSFKLRVLWQAVWPAFVIIVGTLIVTSFFWLPAYVELDYTQSRRVDSPFSEWPRFEQHFTDWSQMVGWPEEPGDPDLTNPPISIKLGIGTTVLGMVGLMISLFHRRYRHFHWWMWALITAVSLILANRTSWFVWTHLPLPEFVQLPTRFFGPASLGIAVLAGIVPDWLVETRKIQSQVVGFLFIFCAGAVVVSGWFWLYPAYCDAPTYPTTTTMAAATLWDDTGAIYRWGGASTGETLPRWVDVLPDANAFIPAYEAGEPINRLLLPDTAVLLDWQTSPGRDEYRLQLEQPTTLIYRAFYIPYWHVTVNGKAASFSPHPVDGLIQVAVPAGEIDLVFSFGPTMLRLVTLVCSGLFAVGLLWWGRRRELAEPTLPVPSLREWEGAILIVGVLWLAFVLVQRTNNPFHAVRLQDGRLSGIDHPMQIPFEGEFVYLGYSGPQQIAADETAVFTQYWRAQRGIGVPYRFRLRLADDDGRVWNLPLARPDSYAPLPGKPGWDAAHYARDAYKFSLLPGTPPGTYWLEARVFRSDIDISLMPQGVETAANPSLARIGQITVTPGQWRLTADNAAVDVYQPTPLTGLPGLTLSGWTVPDSIWRSGETAQIDLLWQAEAKIVSSPDAVVLWLANEMGQRVAQKQVTIGGEAYPVSQWPQQAVVRDQVLWWLPATLETARYSVWLDASGQAVQLGTWQIEAPPHHFTAPPVQETAVLTTSFANLYGFNWGETAVQPGNTVELELVWQAQASADASYRVFVHLLDENDSIITQADAVPDHWTRPTTGWVPGEFIRDQHSLTIPADAPIESYTLRIGWYDAATGERLGEVTIHKHD